MKPSIGRIVHVTADTGGCIPAIVCNVDTIDDGSGETYYRLDVVAFDCGGSRIAGAVGMADVGPDRWHWPEREKD